MPDDKFETSDIAETTLLVFIGWKYTTRRVGRKCYFQFDRKAMEDIQKFKDLRVKIYDDVFQNN